MRLPTIRVVSRRTGLVSILWMKMDPQIETSSKFRVTRYDRHSQAPTLAALCGGKAVWAALVLPVHARTAMRSLARAHHLCSGWGSGACWRPTLSESVVHALCTAGRRCNVQLLLSSETCRRQHPTSSLTLRVLLWRGPPWSPLPKVVRHRPGRRQAHRVARRQVIFPSVPWSSCWPRCATSTFFKPFPLLTGAAWYPWSPTTGSGGASNSQMGHGRLSRPGLHDPHGRSG